MRTVLFYIPEQIGGVPLLGWGALLAVWVVLCAVLLVVSCRRQGWNAETQGYLPMMLLIAAAIVWLLPRMAEPELGIAIRGYGVMMLAGIVAGVGLALRRARDRAIDSEHIYSLAFWMVIVGVVGARAYFVIKEWSSFQRPTWGETLLAVINIPEGGLVVYGSLGGALLAFVVYTVRQRLSMFRVADVIAPSMMLGLAFGRVGCFLNGCCFGGLSELPWSLRFPWQSPPQIQHVRQGLIDLHGIRLATDEQSRPVIAAVAEHSLAAAQGLKPGQRVVMVQGFPAVNVKFVEDVLLSLSNRDKEVVIQTAGEPTPRQWALRLAQERSLPIHPAQLYATLGALLVLGVLLAYEPFRRTDGEVFAVFLIVYPVLRFAEEMLRRDEPAIGGLKIAQWISVVLLLAGSGLWIALRQRSTTARPFEAGVEGR